MLRWWATSVTRSGTASQLPRSALIVALGGPAARGLLDAGLPRGQLCETVLLEFRDR